VRIVSILSPIIIGAIIGYITNYLAIKMLFRPLNPVYIGNFRLPFTPGIVPKRKKQLATILGNAIVERFFNADDLEIIFTSDYFKNAVADAILDFVCKDNVTIGEIAGKSENAAKLTEKGKETLCKRIQDALLQADFSKLVAEKGGELVQKKFGSSILGKAISNTALASISGHIAEEIEKYIKNDSRTVIMPLLDGALNDLYAKTPSELTAKLAPDREKLHQAVCDGYTKFMRTRVRGIVESIDVGGTITAKFNLLDPGEVEALVLAVVNREFQYILWLGALLGAVIGAVNIFI